MWGRYAPLSGRFERCCIYTPNPIDENATVPYTFTATPGFAPGVFVRVVEPTGHSGFDGPSDRASVERLMATGDHTARELVNESRINVAALLQEPVGSFREVHIQLDAFSLDDDLIANDLDADLRLIRLQHHVLADGTVHANVALECVRCLTTFEQAIKTKISEQFRQSHDVRTGATISEHRDMDGEELEDDDDEAFVIDEGHELDLAEAFRQNLLLAIPMVPVCGDDCPGPPADHLVADTDTAEEREGQFDVLSRLLDDDDDTKSADNE